MLPLFLIFMLAMTLLPVSSLAQVGATTTGSKPTAAASGVVTGSAPQSGAPVTPAASAQASSQASQPEKKATASPAPETVSAPPAKLACTAPPPPKKVPDIALVKTGPASVFKGDSVTFHFKVTNTGEVNFTNVIFNDNLLGIHNKSLGALAVGASKEWDDSTYTVPAGFQGSSFKNSASVTGKSECQDVSDCSECCVQVKEKLPPKPAISLVKTGPASAFKGDQVTFHFKVTNTGEVNFTDVIFNDDLLGIHNKNLGALAVGASKEWDETYTIPAGYTGTSLKNTAGVTGKSGCADATATADCTVLVLEKPKPAISLVKTGPASAFKGDQVTFHFKVTNTGEVDFTDVIFNDDLLGIHNKSLGALAIGASKEWDETYTIPAGCTDLSIKNTAGVTGMSDFKEATATAECSVKINKPGIKLEKSGPASANVGETITYNFKITNTGDGDLVNVKVNDPLLGGEILTLAKLAHGSSYEFSKTYTIPQDFVGGTLKNSATVAAAHDCDIGCPVSGDASCETTVCHPSIIVTKKGPECARVGDTITYDFTVKNNGDCWLFWANAYDPMLGDPAAAGVIWGTLLMAPNEVATFSKTYVVKDTDPDPLYNQVTAVGGLGLIPCISGTVSATAEWRVDIINPKIELTKTPSDTCFRVGDTVTYNFTVKNTGDCKLTGVTVSDPMLGGTIFGPVDMDAGTQQTFSKTYVVKDTDPDPLPNTATAKGKPCCGADVTAQASASVDIIHPKIELTKTPSDTCFRVGDTVTYNFTVKNTGDCKLTGVTVSDPMLGGVIFGPVDMDAGTQLTFSRTYVVTDTDPDPLLNTATATGKPPCGDDVTATADASVDIIHPKIELVKDGPAEANVGDTITYNFTVKNTGDCKLTGVTVSDPKLGGVIFGPVDMDSGTQQTFSKTYVVLQSDVPVIVNTATTSGKPPCGDDVTATAKHTVNIQGTLLRGAISITKVNNSGTVQVGDTINFTITVKNTGQTKIMAPVTVTDTYDTAKLSFKSATPAPDSSADTGSLTWTDISGGAGLNVGASKSITVSFRAKDVGTTVNRCTVSARDENDALLGGHASAPATITEATIPVTPKPSVTPSISPTATTAATTTTATTTSTLPRTGDNLSIYLTMAWILIPLGLVLMMLAFLARRRNARGAEIER